MHTSLPFGHRSKNQLFSKLTLCPLREIVLWPFLVWWTMSWRVYKPWRENGLTDQVTVYSHIFFQQLHTKGIFTLTLPFPISLQQALFQDGCPENPQRVLITILTCILQTGRFSRRMTPIAEPASTHSRALQIFFDVGLNLHPKSFWANPESPLVARKIGNATGCFTEIKCLWEIDAPSLFSLPMLWSKSVLQKKLWK